jgi:hypothetical protein
MRRDVWNSRASKVVNAMTKLETRPGDPVFDEARRLSSNAQRYMEENDAAARPASYEHYLRVKTGISDNALLAAGLKPAKELSYQDFMAAFGGKTAAPRVNRPLDEPRHHARDDYPRDEHLPNDQPNGDYPRGDYPRDDYPRHGYRQDGYREDEYRQVAGASSGGASARQHAMPVIADPALRTRPAPATSKHRLLATTSMLMAATCMAKG